MRPGPATVAPGGPLGNTQVFRPGAPQGRAAAAKAVAGPWLGDGVLPIPAAADRARLAFGLRRLVRSRVALCRTVRTGPTVQLLGRVNESGEGRLVVRGIATCGSVHSCPTCAAPILTHRAAELTQALDACQRDHAALVTLTLRHARGMSLQLLQVLLARAYSALKGGRGGQELRRALGHFGDVRAAEQTWGAESGWHPHLHAIWFLHAHPPENMRELLSRRWATVVRATFRRLQDVAIEMMQAHSEDSSELKLRAKVLRTLGARYNGKDLRECGRAALRELTSLGSLDDVLPDHVHGVHAETLETGAAAKYLAKMGLELAGITTKQAHEGHYSSWQIAQRAARGDATARALWTEHERAMKGRRQLTWSRGAREALGLDPERPDALLAAEQEPPPTETETLLAEVDAEQWDTTARNVRQLLLAELHECYARGDLPTIAAPVRDGPSRDVTPGPKIAPVWWETMASTVRARASGARRTNATVAAAAARRKAPRVRMTLAERELLLQECADHLVQDLGLTPF